MFGNQYEKVKNPASYDKAGKNMLAHRWAMFITLDNDVELTQRYIKEVQYILHPTYKVNKITLNKAPFLLSRTAYGSFNVECHITF